MRVAAQRTPRGETNTFGQIAKKAPYPALNTTDATIIGKKSRRNGRQTMREAVPLMSKFLLRSRSFAAIRTRRTEAGQYRRSARP